MRTVELVSKTSMGPDGRTIAFQLFFLVFLIRTNSAQAGGEPLAPAPAQPAADTAQNLPQLEGPTSPPPALVDPLPAPSNPAVGAPPPAQPTTDPAAVPFPIQKSFPVAPAARKDGRQLEILPPPTAAEVSTTASGHGLRAAGTVCGVTGIAFWNRILGSGCDLGSGDEGVFRFGRVRSSLQQIEGRPRRPL